jgi:hypothetical protein
MSVERGTIVITKEEFDFRINKLERTYVSIWTVYSEEPVFFFTKEEADKHTNVLICEERINYKGERFRLDGQKAESKMIKGIYPQPGDSLNNIKPYIVEEDGIIKWVCLIE